jgi:hypothetical protein
MSSLRIPITMCHGVRSPTDPERKLTPERFHKLMAIAHDLGFQSITYHDLVAWRNGSGAAETAANDRFRSSSPQHAPASLRDLQ